MLYVVTVSVSFKPSSRRARPNNAHNHPRHLYLLHQLIVHSKLNLKCDLAISHYY
jgi:hypothetical protein